MKKIWDKLSNDFKVIDDENLKMLGINPAQITKAFNFNDEMVVFVEYDDGEEFIKSYEEQMSDFEKKSKGKNNWKNISPIKPVFYNWINIKDKKLYISIFETYNSLNKLSLQIYVEIDDTYVGISTAIKRSQSLSLEKIIKEPLIKNIIRAII